MARYGYGMSVSGSRTAVVASSGVPTITTSRAFDSGGGQVGSTNTGDIPVDWVKNEATVTSVIFANDNSVTSIGSYAFAYTGLTTITMPNSVTSIAGDAFTSCGSLASITLSNSLTSIGENAFGLSGLTSITIPNSVLTIDPRVFVGCSSLATATFTATSSVTSIGSEAFKNTALTSITIPNSVTSIGNYAFQNCSSLATATIGTDVTSIGSYAFDNCTSLVTVLCYVAQSAFTGSGAFYYNGATLTLTIRARSTDASWTAGTGLTFQGHPNVTVIKNL